MESVMRDILSIGLACLLGIVGMLFVIDFVVVPAESDPVSTVAAGPAPASPGMIEVADASEAAAPSTPAPAIPPVRDVTKDPYVTGPPPAEVMERLERMAKETELPRPKPRPPMEQAFDDDTDSHIVTVYAAHEGGQVMRVVQVRAAPESRTRGKPRCTTFKTYNPETGTYRGYDGLIHQCPAW
jgi:hypothetical protein